MSGSLVDRDGLGSNALTSTSFGDLYSKAETICRSKLRPPPEVRSKGQTILSTFLKENKIELLETAERESTSLAGVRPTTNQLKMGLPVFYQHLIDILANDQSKSTRPTQIVDNIARERAASSSDEVAMTLVSGHPADVHVAKSAGLLGAELFRLGYTLSHVVHVYGSLCQAITGLATTRGFRIGAFEFSDLNRALDVALASAVTEFQRPREAQVRVAEVKRCGFCAHELRNTLGAAMMSYQLIKSGEVGLSGSVGGILERSLKRMDELIGRSLTETKLLGGSPVLDIHPLHLLLLVDQLLVTANIEAKSRRQVLEVDVDPNIVINVDLQFFHSALSNLIQNALKYSHEGGRIKIRGHIIDEQVVIEVEDECGGLAAGSIDDLFKPFEQQNENRKGLGLGLTLARKAIELHKGTIQAQSIPGQGCVFSIKLPAASVLE